MKKGFTFFALVLSSIMMITAADIVVTTVEDGTAEGIGIPSGSFREAVANAQSGDVIKFNVTNGDTVKLVSAIIIDGAEKTLVIDGLNQATGRPVIFTKSSEAAANARLLHIATSGGSEGLDVTIKNISFEKTHTEEIGGAINCGSSSYGSTAGDPVDFKVTLDRCSFKNNTSVFPSGKNAGGGVVCVNHGTDMIIKNCLFAYNRNEFTTGPDGSKSYGGGCISSAGNNTAKLTLINSTFYGNYSDGRGGAVFIGHPTDLINCTFAGNTGQRGGGFYFHNNIPANVINCIFVYNYDMYSPVDDNGDLTSAASAADFYRNNGSATMATFAHNIAGEAAQLGDISALGANNVDFIDGMPLFASYTTDEASNKIPVLADNGGFFETIALSENGVATRKGIVSISGFTIPTTDQRGYLRETPPSIGAFEYGAISGVDAPEFVSGGINSVGKQVLFAAGLTGNACIYNLSGNCIYQAEINGGGLTPAFHDGIYIVKFVQTTGSNIISKIIIK